VAQRPRAIGAGPAGLHPLNTVTRTGSPVESSTIRLLDAAPTHANVAVQLWRRSSRCPVAAVVLAAGAATRFGSPKQQLLLGAVLDRLAGSAEVDEIVVAAGAYELDVDARVVLCPDWRVGPGESLRCGLRALAPETAAVVVVLADGPDLAPAAVDRVVRAWREEAGTVVAASYRGIRGHPVVLDRTVWDRIPDEGARALEPVLVPCDDLGEPGDVDRPADLPERFRPS
jgi:CTP:molybdopterin cytidylyltransferase MocA